MTDTAARAVGLRDALHVAAAGDQALIDPVDAVDDKLIADWRLAATHSGGPGLLPEG